MNLWIGISEELPDFIPWSVVWWGMEERYFWEEYWMGECPSLGLFFGCIICPHLIITLFLTFLCGLGVLVRFPLVSIMLLLIGKQWMWYLFFCFLENTPFILGGEMWESGTHSRVNLFLQCLVNPSPLVVSVFSSVWRITVPRKVRFFTWHLASPSWSY